MEIDFARLDRAFNPRCVAVVGDKGKLQWTNAEFTFQGKLYSVQISPNSIKAIEAMGVKNYTSLLDIPEPVDLAIVAVPRAAALQILEDCITKGVAAAHFFTAGFGETDTEEGRQLESRLAARAKEANLYLIGPNCMGIFNPKIGIRQNELQYTGVAGPVGFISQSGTHAAVFAYDGHFQGADIDKSVSFGNGAVLDSPDYLEYFGQDAAVKVIGMYLEGVKDGKRFLSVLRKVAALKPVVIWKGGRTGEGSRAIASHTGSLAIPQAIWQAAVRQCGAINVTSMEELIDTVKALLYLSPVRGKRVGVVGSSGGLSVAISDAFAESGLEVPLLSPESYDKLTGFFSLVGASYRNPVDTGFTNRKETMHILDILDRDPNIDNLALLLMPRTLTGLRSLAELEDEISLVIDIRKRSSKPVLLIIPYYYYTTSDLERMGNIIPKIIAGGIPIFVTVERAARALRNTLAYYSRKDI